MTQANRLHFKPLWLVIGFGMIAFVIYESLTPSPVNFGMGLSDKVYHTTGYFGMMAWFCQIYNRTKARLGWGLYFIAMGIGLEFLQGMSGVRNYEVNDMFANSAGVVLAFLISLTRFSHLLNHVDRIIAKETA